MASDPAMLTTVTRLQAELKNAPAVLTDAAVTELSTIICEVSHDLASRCNRTFYYQSFITENVAGYASCNLQVTACPIDTTQPVVVMFDSSEIDSNVYTVSNPDLGYIFNRTGWYYTAPLLPNVQQDPFPGYENKLYQVSYSGGWVTPQQAADNPDDPILSIRTLPYDLERACLLCCVQWYRMQGQNPLFQSERLMTYFYAYNKDGKIPFVEDCIARHRRTGMSS